MEWKKKISQLLTVTCSSFTIIMLLYALLFGDENIPINQATFILFAVCAMTSVAIFLTDFIPIKSVPLRFAIDFIDVFLTVFLFGGGVLGMFPFKLRIMLIVFGMLTVAYVGVVAVMLITEQIIAEDINKKISEMKHKNID